MIRLKDLTKRFGDFMAVDHLNLEIPKGEIFGFLGPNGAGKTTTIKMMSGILKPTSGHVSICAIPMATEPEAAKNKVGFIPDRPYLYEKLTGMEFLKFTADLYGVEETRFPQKAMVVLEQFSLAHWSGELIESYSHGMKQRLIMAAALLHEPEVIIVDEPMVGLDPKASRLVKDIFKSQAEKGMTIFMSTHSLLVAQEVCHEIAIIQAGKIIAMGSAEDLKRQAGIDGDLESIFLKLTEGKTIAHEKSLSSA
jgi:ABC-2 type transport system ATP-binding protein